MNRTFKHDIGTLIPGLRIVHASATTTTSGTLAATQTNYGMSLTKTATETGRYTCQLLKSTGAADTAIGFINAIVTIVGPDDTAMTDAKGVWSGVVRDNDIASDGTIEIQFVDADSGADADLQDGASFNVTLLIKDSNIAQ